jgi:Tfp pilus assembly protein PilX
MKDQTHEEGFILVTSILLLSILTMLGTTALMKSNIQIKVSASSIDSAQAFSAANAGLSENYAYWSWNATGVTEKAAVDTATEAGTTTANVYDGRLAVTSLADLTATVTAAPYSFADVDAFVQGTAGVRVYRMALAGMTQQANSTWNNGVTDPQVAVWAVSHSPQTSTTVYPYQATNTSTGPNYVITVYALGRSGNTLRLMREVQGTSSSTLSAVSAMTNAPTHGNFSQTCSETDPPSANLGGASGWVASIDNTVINITQARYLRDLNNDSSNPSGIALKSNTKLGGGGRGFRNDLASKTGASFERSPMILYSGHGATAAANQAAANLGGWSTTNEDITAPYDNLDLLSSEAPHNLVMSPTMNTNDKLEYFKDANSHLLDMDAYRWGAEQFTCQNTSSADSVDGNGRYCSKAEALRVATGSAAPVSGRITVAEFEYNINYGIPMFGIVRVMVPTTKSGTTFNCTVGGVAYNSEFYDISGAVMTMKTDPAGATGNYDGTISSVDSNGVLDGTARVLVYGTLFFDFFTDEGDSTKSNIYDKKTKTWIINDAYENNNVFDPAIGERLLHPLEAIDSYMKVEVPILINPAMPRSAVAMEAFPTAAPAAKPTGSAINLSTASKVNMTGSGVINLASPYDGVFPLSEGLLPQTGSTNYEDGLAGTMRLMSNQNTYTGGAHGGGNFTMAAEGLVSISNALNATPAIFPPVGAQNLFTAHDTALEYYHDMMVANANKQNPFSWPIEDFPTDMSSDTFYIGQEDSVVGNNDGDMLSLLFPSGYMHGWKVALAALDMDADEWNSLLTNLDANQATQHNPARNYGDASRPKGSPFHTTSDAGFAAAASLETDQNKYFIIKKDPTTGYGLLDETWKDLPGEIYAGGIIDMHTHANIGGVVYTPGALDWEPGNSDYANNDNHLAYISGAIITGYGSYVKNKVTDARYVVSYGSDSVDNLNTLVQVIAMTRYARQELK